MPTQQTAFVYPGQVLLEGVNLSEGRDAESPPHAILPAVLPAAACIILCRRVQTRHD
jgi:uncharacterized protein YbbC (DUF1343 family)